MNALPEGSKIQVNIREQTRHGRFHDALYYTPEAWAKLTQAQLDADKQARVDAWIYRIEHPPVPVEPTDAELEEQKEEIDRQQDELLRQEDDIFSRLKTKLTREKLIAYRDRLLQEQAELDTRFQALKDLIAAAR